MRYKFIPSTLEHLAVPLDAVTLYPGNARRGDVARIAGSIARHGQYRPIVVNLRAIAGQANVILAGNHTWRGMSSLARRGATHIAATFVDVDAETAARINLIDNKLSDDAGYDVDALLRQLRTLPDLEGSGYASSDVDSLLRSLQRFDESDAAGRLGVPAASSLAPGQPAERADIPDGAYAGDTAGDVGTRAKQRLDKLQFGDREIPLTSDEALAFDAALQDHILRTGTTYGFIRSILT